jgi:squalene cyclase
MNSIAFVKRMFKQWQEDTLRIMHDWYPYLTSEMADFYMDRDIADVEETVVSDWCPRIRYLEREADKRGLR